MAFSFFRIENDVLVLDIPEIRGIPTFRRILERDRGSKGDMDGRKKFRAWKEFYYVYEFADLRSYLNRAGYNDKQKHKQAIIDAQLDSDFKVDDELKATIEEYQRIQIEALPSIKSVNTVLKGLKLTDTIAKSIINNIETTIEAAEKIKKDKTEKGEPMDLATDLATTNALIGQLDILVDMSNKLPKTIETLSKLEEKLLKEESGDNIARGGKSVGNRADPKK